MLRKYLSSSTKIKYKFAEKRREWGSLRKQEARQILEMAEMVNGKPWAPWYLKVSGKEGKKGSKKTPSVERIGRKAKHCARKEDNGKSMTLGAHKNVQGKKDTVIHVDLE